jgi:hypothetical protein
VLYEVVREHLDPWLERARSDPDREVPSFVEPETALDLWVQRESWPSALLAAIDRRMYPPAEDAGLQPDPEQLDRVPGSAPC